MRVGVVEILRNDQLAQVIYGVLIMICIVIRVENWGGFIIVSGQFDNGKPSSGSCLNRVVTPELIKAVSRRTS